MDNVSTSDAHYMRNRTLTTHCASFTYFFKSECVFSICRVIKIQSHSC